MGALTIDRVGVPPATLNEGVISRARPSTLDHHGRLADGRLMCIFHREGLVAMVKGAVSEAVPDKGSGYSSNLGTGVKRRLSR